MTASDLQLRFDHAHRDHATYLSALDRLFRNDGQGGYDYVGFRIDDGDNRDLTYDEWHHNLRYNHEFTATIDNLSDGTHDLILDVIDNPRQYDFHF